MISDFDDERLLRNTLNSSGGFHSLAMGGGTFICLVKCLVCGFYNCRKGAVVIIVIDQSQVFPLVVSCTVSKLIQIPSLVG